ncbi:transcription factor HES-1-B-like [Haliotis asinina]|uniref:transcription factor HES-1-B-like n=1 Tax=Haliotis asinina TaxID=109174 RepID=UPI003531C5C0
MHSDKVSTTAGETRDRKSTKPIMEKRRRARINASLSELKSLLLEVIKKEGGRHNKMEKADILEMTVKHLREIQRHSLTASVGHDPINIDKQRLGFNECAQEVSRYLSTIDGCDVELRARVLDHLASCVTGDETSSSSPPPPVTSLPLTPPTPPAPLPAQTVTSSSVSSSSEQPLIPQTTQSVPFSTDINNNVAAFTAPQPVQATKVVSGLQVIPTKLQNGEIAFVLPTNVLGGSHVPNYIIPVYTSPNASPTKPPVTMAMTGAPAAGSVMTIMPSADVFQTCALAPLPGNINILSGSVTSPHSVSPCSSSDSSMLSLSPTIRNSANDVRDVRDVRHHDLGELREVRHPQASAEPVWRPWH